MRIWQTILDYAKRDPRGFNADGRTLGLGLAVAMEKANQNTTADVEAFLRRRAAAAHSVLRRRSSRKAW